MKELNFLTPIPIKYKRLNTIKNGILSKFNFEVCKKYVDDDESKLETANKRYLVFYTAIVEAINLHTKTLDSYKNDEKEYHSSILKIISQQLSELSMFYDEYTIYKLNTQTTPDLFKSKHTTNKVNSVFDQLSCEKLDWKPFICDLVEKKIQKLIKTNSQCDETIITDIYNLYYKLDQFETNKNVDIEADITKCSSPIAFTNVSRNVNLSSHNAEVFDGSKEKKINALNNKFGSALIKMQSEDRESELIE